jgi:hypothetical protein
MYRYHFTISIFATLAAVGVSGAATPKEIDAAVQKGADFLKQQYNGVKFVEGPDGVGPTALAGLALLEAGTSVDDKAVKAITERVRDAAFSETHTYQISLCILYLDRLGEPGDVPIIQMLAVRLLMGQNSHGGWTYVCVDPVPQADEARLRASLTVTELKAQGKNPLPGGKADNTPGEKPKVGAVGKLDAEVEKYAAKLATSRQRLHGDDNSNTQFGVLGVWVARKHGVPVESALDLIERRFLAMQTANGGWPYSGRLPGSPSMTCAGLIALATAVGRREEHRMKAELSTKPESKSEPKTKPSDTTKPSSASEDPFFNPPPKPDDPFFNPPNTEPAPKTEPKAKKADPPKGNNQKPHDVRDIAIERGFAALASALAGEPPPGGPKGKGAKPRVLGGLALGDRDFYFLWSMERVGVIYGIDKIGKFDWYDLGADELVNAQQASGGWGRGNRASIVDTSFAVLFLSRSNFVRDLSSKVQRDMNAELRAGGPPPQDPVPAPAPVPKQPVIVNPPPTLPTPTPAPANLDAKALAAELTLATGTDWDKALATLRDGKGSAYTQALVLATGKLDGERKKAAREALAERLTRMTAATLREMVKNAEPELRRAAALAMAMKDDKEHIPDLVVALNDPEEAVIRAARAGLKSLTGEDFGPAPGATDTERAAAIRKWSEWIKKNK